MNAKETLEKYGLATDVKSIKERLYGGHFSYARFLIGYIEKNEGIIEYDSVTSADFCGRWSEIKDADLALLCDLAEKGERRYRPSEHKIEMTLEEAWAQVADEAEPFVVPECIEKVSAALKKGERYEKAVKARQDRCGVSDDDRIIYNALDEIIAEAEGAK